MEKRNGIRVNSVKLQSKYTAYVQILSAAVLWGIIGVWNRRLMARGLTPVDIVAVRNTGGMLLLSALFLLRDRSVFRVRREHLIYFIGTGIVSVVLFTICYFTCQQLCSLSAASILLYTAPSFVVALSAVLWKVPITKRKLSALVLTLLGCTLVCGLFSRDGTGGALSVTAAGVLTGLGAGFFYALYSIFGRYALARYSPMTVTVWTFLFAGPASLLLIGPAAALTGRPSGLGAMREPGTVLLALCLAAFSTAAPYVLYTAGLSKVEPGQASIMASVEPVAASLAGVLLFHEPMNATGAMGIICVLAGVWILR